MNSRRPFAWLTALGLAATVCTAGSCESFNQYCTDAMDCEGGNEADIEACEVSKKAASAEASELGCSDEFDLLQECQELESTCEDAGDNDVYTTIDGTDDKCESEGEDYANCIGDDRLGG